MVLVLDETLPKARCEHTCDVCLGTIGTGDQYLRQRNVGDDGAYTFKAHALCWSAWRKAFRDLDLYDDEAPDNHEDVMPLVQRFFVSYSGRTARRDA